MVRAAPRAMPGLSKSLSARLGSKPGGGASRGTEAAPRPQVDARLKIIQKTRANTVDARDKLAKMAKTMDARQKLEKIRNMKEGKLEVKKIGAITLTKRTGGKIVLTTSKGAAAAAAAAARAVPERREPVEVKAVGQFLKTTSSTGQVTFQSKSSKKQEGMRSKSESLRLTGGGQLPPLARGSAAAAAAGGGGVSRHGQGPLSAARKRYTNEELDDVLMNTAIDPRELKKIRVRSADERPVQRYRDPYDRSRSPVGGSRSPPLRSRSPLGRSRSPMRSRSPLGRSRSPLRGGARDEWRGRREPSPLLRRPAGGRVYDYDDPRMLEHQRQDEVLRRRLKQQEAAEQEERITLGGRLEQGSTVSPLQGTKVVITNLQTSVTQDDIVELFGDVGPLKRAKLVTPGHAEVCFVNHSHAKNAVDIYHNRQLDGKPMRCQLVGANSVAAVGGPTMKLPPSLARKRREGEDNLGPRPDVEAIHKALFKKPTGKKPSFTITLPKKTKDDPEDW